jgi:DUF1365 family protein
VGTGHIGLARPHWFPSVPRIYEKIYSKINAGAESKGGAALKIFRWACDVGNQVSDCKLSRQPIPFLLGLKYALATKLVFSKVQAALPDVGVERVQILCFPRILGYVFNPLTVYYCYASEGHLTALVYEVNNTFGDRHHYVLPVDSAEGRSLAQSCSKRMYVSPFNAVEGEYEFHVSAPGEKLAVGVNLRVDGAPVLKAYLVANARTLSDRALVKAFAGMPAMTFKVIAAIHWEALLLWLKGLRVAKRPKQAAPLHSLSMKNKSNL